MRITQSAQNILGSFIWHQKQTVTLAVGCSKALIMFLLPTAFIKCQFGKWCRCFTFIVIIIIILFIFLTIYLNNYDIWKKNKSLNAQIKAAVKTENSLELCLFKHAMQYGFQCHVHIHIKKASKCYSQLQLRDCC